MFYSNSIRSNAATTHRQGAMIVLVAVVLPVVVLLSALAVDIAWMQLVNTELRTATDAAARAGAKVLSLSQDQATARTAAIDAASQNLVAGTPLPLAAADIQFGRSEQTATGRFRFTPASSGIINAVHVDGQRTQGSLGGPVNLFFAQVLGVNAYEPRQQATATMLERDICLVIDRSGSMGSPVTRRGGGNGQNCGPLRSNTRFAALDRAIEVFLIELDRTFPEEQVALASYSSSVRLNCRGWNLRFDVADIREPLTQDYDAIRDEMDEFMTRGISGRTAIGAGLRKGIEAISGDRARPFAMKTIVLMTDGLHNLGVEPAIVAREAAAQNITVHTISFSPGADQVRMRRVASITGGEHYHADSEADLSSVFREIARTLPVLLTE